MTLRLFSQRALARIHRDQQGATAVEFALVAPIFLSILFAIVQVFVVWLAKSQLQIATEYAARLVLTNQTSTTYNTETAFKTALCSQLAIIVQCSGVMISLTPASITSANTSTPTLTYDANGNVTNTFAYGTGTGNQVMVLQALYQFPVIAAPLFHISTQANGTLLLVSTVVFENEPQ